MAKSGRLEPGDIYFKNIIDLTTVTLFKFWTLCVFEPLFGDLGTTYDVPLGFIGKAHRIPLSVN